MVDQNRSRLLSRFPWAIAPAMLVALAGCASTKTAQGPTTTEGSTTGGAEPVAAKAPVHMVVVDGKFVEAPAIPMGDPESIARILDEGKNRNHVMETITYISTKIGPRLTGSENAETANRWAADQFRNWGLSNVDVWQWGEIPVRFDRGPSTGKVLRVRRTEPKEGESQATAKVEYDSLRDMEFTTLAWGAGTNGPVRGPVVRMPENEEQLAAVADQIKGSWILIKASAPGGRRGVGGFAGGMSARAGYFAELRQKWAGGDTAKKEEPTPPPKPFPNDGVSGLYEGTVMGGQAPEGTPFSLELRLGDNGAATGTFGYPGYRTGDIKNAKFDPATKELKFTWEGPGGEAAYTLKIDGGTLSGERKVGEDRVMTYKAKLAGPKAAEPPAPTGPTIEERVLKLGPAGFLSASSDDKVRTSSIRGWRTLDYDHLPVDVECQVRQSDYDYINSKLTDGWPIAVEFNCDNRFTKGPIPVYDTIAEIPGTTWPDQVVIVSAHLDSWNGPGSMGTTDNGTGSSVTLEAARILMASGVRPKRTIRFILWTGEEQGLLGSAAYVKAHMDEMPNISAVFVDDGGTNYEGGLQCIPSMVDMLAAATAPVTEAFPDMPVNVQPHDRMPRGGASDHASFNQVGVPGFFWDEVGRADYQFGWHTQNDRIDLAIPEYLVQSSTCAAVTAFNLACADEMLPREPPPAPRAEAPAATPQAGAGAK